jgi:hypothetical protein
VRERPGGSTFELEDLPETVADAVLLVRMLGIRYLWVDTLCIVQDSDHEKQVQISSIVEIYQNAALTIVAACAEDATSRLPGVRIPRKGFQEQVFVQNGTLVSTCLVAPLEPTRDGQNRYDHDRGNYLLQSKWNSRGWKFQESLVSRRCLILCQEQVFWECRSASWCEERELECNPLVRVAWPETRIRFLPPLPTNIGTILTIRSAQDRPFDENLVAGVVERYSKRSLTFDDDALNALRGVLRVWELYCDTHFLQGLSDHILERSLWWHGS